LAPPQVYGFEYSQGLNKLSKTNYRMMIQAWLDYFEDEIFNNWKPDLIHAQNTNMAGIIARYISDRFHIPYSIIDEHHVSPILPAYIQKEIKQALLSSNANCFVSEWQYRTYLLLDTQIEGEVIGNMLDEEMFKIKQSPQNDKFTIIHVSSGFFWKDIKTLAKSLDYFYEGQKDLSKIRILIIGMDKKVEEEFLDFIINSTLKQHIEFISYVKHSKISDYYVQNSVFVFSSVMESFGIAPLEAMLCGIPVVATSNGGLDEYIKPYVNGVKVPLKDSKGLAEAMLKVYNKEIIFDPEKVRASAVVKFNKETFRYKMSGIYNKCLGI
jgi:glycosyltransferase involved in cell wall biosynthesis